MVRAAPGRYWTHWGVLGRSWTLLGHHSSNIPSPTHSLPPLPIFRKEPIDDNFWALIRAAGPASDSSDDHLQVDFLIDIAKVDNASGDGTPIVSQVQADQSTQQDNSGSTIAPVEYADGITSKFRRFRCKTCNTAYVGYLVQPPPWADNDKCSCGGGT